MNRSAKGLHAIIVHTIGVLLAGVLSACSPSENDSSSTSAPTQTYLFYYDPLSAVDPASPAAPIAIEPPGTAIGNVTTVEHATYIRSLLYLLDDRHHRTIVYKKNTTGTLWKVSALKSGGLTPAQISNETAATTLCTTLAEPDYADHGNAEFVYSLPGTDTNCNTTADNIWKMVKVGMSATDTPYTAYQQIAAIHNVATGAISGWLAINGTNLNAYDANFGNPVLVSAFTTSVSKVMTTSDDRVFLNIDNSLRVYNPRVTPAVLSGSLYTVSSAVSNAVRDNLNLYFNDGLSIYQLPLDGSAPAIPISTEVGVYINSIMLTPDRVIYSNGFNGPLKSVAKGGGTVTTLSASGSLVGTAGTRVYYNTLVFGTPWVYTARVINDDGTGGTQHNAAAWTLIQPTLVSYGTGGNSLPMNTVLLRGGATAAPYTLSSYDAANHTLIASLGTFPADLEYFTDFYFTRLPNNDNLLVQSSSSANGSYDVLLLNTRSANSLVRITDTSADNETPVANSGCTINPRAELDLTLILLLLTALAGVRWRARRTS